MTEVSDWAGIIGRITNRLGNSGVGKKISELADDYKYYAGKGYDGVKERASAFAGPAPETPTITVSKPTRFKNPPFISRSVLNTPTGASAGDRWCSCL